VSSDLAVESVAEAVGFDVEVVLRLKVEPEPWRGAEVAGEAQGSIGGDGPLAVNDLVDATRWNADVRGEPVLRQPGGSEELLEQSPSPGWTGGSFVVMTTS
jgi:hypothetical protein